MRPWLTRGLGMAVLHGIADTALAKAAVYHPTGLLTVRIVVIALLVGAAALWGALDAWLRREDAGRTWLLASLVAGWGSGVLYVIGRGILVDQAGTAELRPALTGGAAFTALLVLIPAGLGLLVGARLNKPQPEEAEPEEERPSPTPRRRRAPSPTPRGTSSVSGRAARPAGGRATRRR
ncbi:B-4DMT family transporter [Amycolatopsis sacchari]|nr:B-4DMT family transporter [Amycolatopsis sacchari]